MQSSRQQPLFLPKHKADRIVNPSMRPPYLTAAIDAEFEETVESNGGGYIFTGDMTTGYFFSLDNILRIESDAVLTKHLKHFTKAIVCDIGAGGFGFEANNHQQFGSKVQTYGITATAFNATQAPNRAIGQNAEYLSSIFGCEKFDYCFSRATFIHYVDPIGSIIEAYKTLKLNGILLIDRFYLPGCEEYLPHLIPYLRKQGYRVAGTADDGDIKLTSGFVIQKTFDKPHLEFPLIYDTIMKSRQRVTYKASWGLRLAMLQYSSQQHYQMGIDLIKSQIATLTECAHLLHKHDHLLDLFSDEDYQRASMIEKYFLILGIATHCVPHYAKLMNQANIVGSEHTLFSHLYSTYILRSANSEYYVKMCLLAREPLLTKLSLEQQILLIQVAAVTDVLLFVNSSESKKALLEMGIAFSQVEVYSCYKNNDELNFTSMLAHAGFTQRVSSHNPSKRVKH